MTTNTTSPAVVAAIDLGYGFTKFTAGKDAAGKIICKSFPSMAAAARKKTLGAGVFQERDTINVSFNGMEYEVGQDVELAMGGWSARVLDLNYTTSDTYQALMRGALKMMAIKRIDVLVLGAPISNFDEVKKHLVDHYTGTIQIDHDNNSVEIAKVVVVPQPLGGFAYFAKDANTYATLRDEASLIIDPGYFTLDWLVSRGTIQQADRSGAFPGGVSAIIRALADAVTAQCGGDVNSVALWGRIDRCLFSTTKKSFFYDGREWVLGEYAAAMRTVVNQAVSAMVSKVGNPRDISNVIMIGGGAKYFVEAVRKHFPKHAIKITDSNRYANVQGFFTIGEQILNGTQTRPAVK